MSLLITGATGFIGKELIKELKDYPENIYILVRAFSLSKAVKLFSDYKNIHFITGDITYLNVLDNDRDLEILKDTTKIIHLGGGYDIQMSEEAAYLQNVIGTQNIIALSKKLLKLSEFHLVSSFSVVGIKLEQADAHTFAKNGEKLSHYAESKKQAEKMARATFNKDAAVSLVIYRPAIVIPHVDGKLEKIDGAFYLLDTLIKLEKKMKFLPQKMIGFYPYDKDAYLPLVSVKSVAVFMGKIIKMKNELPLQSYYILDRKNKSIRQFIEESFFHFNFRVNVNPMPLRVGKKLMFGFGIVPKEISNFMFFKTDLHDDKKSEDFSLVERNNHVNIQAMATQLRAFIEERVNG